MSIAHRDAALKRQTTDLVRIYPATKTHHGHVRVREAFPMRVILPSHTIKGLKVPFAMWRDTFVNALARYAPGRHVWVQPSRKVTMIDGRKRFLCWFTPIEMRLSVQEWENMYDRLEYLACKMVVECELTTLTVEFADKDYDVLGLEGLPS